MLRSVVQLHRTVGGEASLGTHHCFQRNFANAANEKKARILEQLRPHFPQRHGDEPRVIYLRTKWGKGLTRWLRGVTIDLNFDFGSWNWHTSKWRHLRLWLPHKWGSTDVFRRLLFPDLALVATTSSFVCWYNLYQACDPDQVQTILQPGFDTYLHHDMLSLPLQPFTLCSVVLGLLVTFKTQSSHLRYVEGRMLWGATINECRGLASRFLALQPVGAPEASAGKLCSHMHAVKLVQTFPLVLKYHLTQDGFIDDIDMNATMTKECFLELELSVIWDLDKKPERAYVSSLLAKSVQSRPLHVLHELMRLTSVMGNATPPVLTPVSTLQLDKSIIELVRVLGACERIFRTPIYTPYTEHTSRFLTLWCNALPFALYPIVGPGGTIPMSIFISFFMLGIEDIGSYCEEPFHLLPLWQYCEAVRTSCDQLIEQHEQQQKQQ